MLTFIFHFTATDDFDTVFNQTSLDNCTVYCKGLSPNTTSKDIFLIYNFKHVGPLKPKWCYLFGIIPLSFHGLVSELTF